MGELECLADVRVGKDVEVHAMLMVLRGDFCLGVYGRKVEGSEEVVQVQCSGGGGHQEAKTMAE